ncbi:hypothetical protein [uncultured Adlercreutzia sp.]|uniref:hypothetical protein n=1 Tax=uncultured Adlercreutzia sp. TaxID=875803 RepID=UPI0025E7533F|nr:hypothetical protein [uncultured Adlercreutzia sp.]MCI9262488.1 hypothetical protein [Eggerthellaceae bacterium]
MFEQDYLMRIIAQLLGAIRRSMERASGEDDPDGAAQMLDAALGEATDLDGEALLSLAPESMAQVLQISGVDPHVTEYIARSLLLSSRYYNEAGNAEAAALRHRQAFALADAFGHALSEESVSDEEIEALITQDGGSDGI